MSGGAGERQEKETIVVLDVEMFPGQTIKKLAICTPFYLMNFDTISFLEIGDNTLLLASRRLVLLEIAHKLATNLIEAQNEKNKKRC